MKIFINQIQFILQEVFLLQCLEEVEVCFCRSVWKASEQTDRVSVIRTSEVLAVSTAPPPTNMDRTVTEVSLNQHHSSA